MAWEMFVNFAFVRESHVSELGIAGRTTYGGTEKKGKALR